MMIHYEQQPEVALLASQAFRKVLEAHRTSAQTRQENLMQKPLV